MLQAQMVLDQVISLVTTHWQQDVSEVYVCTSFVRNRKANAVCNTCSLQTKLELLLN